MYGVVDQSLAALRKEPFHRSEMVSQLLFGETFTVLESFRDWHRIKVTIDGYEGWIDKKVCELFDDEQMNLLTLDGASNICTRLFSAKPAYSEAPIRLCPGSTIYGFDSDSGTFRLLNNDYKTFNVPFDPPSGGLREQVIQFAQSYLNAPYLWGGRSPYGIDCSGLSQVVFKMLGVNLARDASQQVLQGTTVDFLNLTQPGDLAFFDDEEGNINHVGIVLPENKIIHSSGFVKIDLLDQQGIYSLKTKKYSHKLRVIKRILEL